MRPTDGQVQESIGVEQWSTRFPELADHGADRNFRRPGAVGVPAHAIDDGKERCAVTDGDRDTILVFFAIPEEAQVRVLDMQWPLRHASFSCKLLLLYNTLHSVPVSGSRAGMSLVSR
jgi:hypothetical protein